MLVLVAARPSPGRRLEKAWCDVIKDASLHYEVIVSLLLFVVFGSSTFLMQFHYNYDRLTQAQLSRVT